MARTAVIVDAVRTPLGRRGGKLKDWHPVDLAAVTLQALVERNNFDPALVDDVVMGCVMQAGEQGLNIGRNAVLAAGWPESVPATTIDRQCGSSQQAAHFAAQGVMAGAYDIAVAAGVEVMSRIPMGATLTNKELGFPFTQSIRDRYAPVGGLQSQGIGAEMIAEKWGITREECDAFSVSSHMKAARATDEGRFQNEIIPVKDAEGNMMTTDEGIRRESSMEGLAKLKTAFKPEGGMITAGNSSQITDGAAAMLIMTEEMAAKLGLKPRARFHTFALAGVDPVTMLTGPIPSTAKALAKSGIKPEDIDLFEVNEAFAPVVLAWAKELGLPLDKTNVNGGAIALGHPLGGSGARIMATMLNELERIGGRYALQTMCEGGGLANATIIERL